jgi:hypothetical protein
VSADVVKTIVVRRGQTTGVFVLIPGDRVISWPSWRALLGVNGSPGRTLKPPTPQRVTSAARSRRSARHGPLVVADSRLTGRAIMLKVQEHGVALALAADAALAALTPLSPR